MYKTDLISDISDIKFINQIIPDIIEIETFNKSTNGCSASHFYDLKVKTIDRVYQFVIKENDVTLDWLSLRSNDSGREAVLLLSPNINSLWEIVENPYISIAIEESKYALLMRDVSECLSNFNHMSIDDCDYLALRALAKMHARFWDNNELDKMPALMRLPGYLQINGPFNNYSNTLQPIGKKIFSGWESAKKLLSNRTYNWLTRPINEVVIHWDNYPNTLLHGDYRPMNLGYSNETNKMVLIDWAFSGFGPCTIDLYWYLISTSCHRDDNERPLKLYKGFIEDELKRQIPEKEWEMLSEIGVVCSCYMLLWEKALNYNKEKDDWDWWLSKLEEIINKYE